MHGKEDDTLRQQFLELLFNFRSNIALPDALIAATALVYDVKLYTLNKKDFDFIQGIAFYKPQTFGYSSQV